MHTYTHMHTVATATPTHPHSNSKKPCVMQTCRRPAPPFPLKHAVSFLPGCFKLGHRHTTHPHLSPSKSVTLPTILCTHCTALHGSQTPNPYSPPTPTHPLAPSPNGHCSCSSAPHAAPRSSQAREGSRTAVLTYQGRRMSMTHVKHTRPTSLGRSTSTHTHACSPWDSPALIHPPIQPYPCNKPVLQVSHPCCAY